MAAELWRYVETSALLAAILEGDPAALSSLQNDANYIASSLTFAEGARVLVRAVAAGDMTTLTASSKMSDLRIFERRCDRIAISDPVLARLASPFPVEPLRSLDAIHLATALALGAPPASITFVSCDRRVRANAAALGFALA